ncbi:MAG: ADP-ribosylation factor-like protein [Candidatus Hodarchaeales archaeon]|jgi:small GTP-binding protein
MPKSIIISYFDSIKGPINYLSVSSEENELIANDILKGIAKFLDMFQADQFFSRTIEEYNSENLFIELPSEWARGKKELILLTFLSSKGDQVLETIEQALRGLAREFLEYKETFRAFYNADLDRKDQKTQESLNEIKTACKEFLRNLPDISSFSVRPQTNKIIFMGLAATGKTSIINYMKNQVFLEESKPTIIQNIVKFVFRNINFLCYDLPGHQKFRNLWKTFLPKTSMIVFVIDSSAPKIQETISALNFILSFLETNSEDVHLVLAFNKQDLPSAQLPEKILTQIQGNSQLPSNLSFLGLSAKTGEGIDHLFETITKILIE